MRSPTGGISKSVPLRATSSLASQMSWSDNLQSSPRYDYQQAVATSSNDAGFLQIESMEGIGQSQDDRTVPVMPSYDTSSLFPFPSMPLGGVPFGRSRNNYPPIPALEQMHAANYVVHSSESPISPNITVQPAPPQPVSNHHWREEAFRLSMNGEFAARRGSQPRFTITPGYKCGICSVRMPKQAELRYIQDLAILCARYAEDSRARRQNMAPQPGLVMG